MVVDPDIDLAQLPDVLIKKCCAAAPTVGNMIIDVEIPNSQGEMERYNVLRPDRVPMYIDVAISTTALFVNNIEDNIKSILLDCFNGKLTTKRPQIYGDIYAADYITALVNEGYRVNSLQLGKSLNSYADVIKYDVDQYPALSDDLIKIRYI